MTCQELQDDLAAYATGALRGADASGVEAHLAGGCAECCAQLAGYREVLGEMGLGLKAAAVPDGAWGRLVARIDGEMGGDEGITTAERGGLRLVVGAGEGDTDSVGAIRMNGYGGAGAEVRSAGRRGWLMPAAVAAVLAGAVTAGVMWGLHSAERGRMGAELTVARSDHEDTKKLLADRETQVSTLTSEAAEARALAGRRLEQVAALEKQLAEGREKLAAVEKRVSELEVLAGERSAELARLKTEKEILDTTLVALRRDVEMLYSGELVTLELKGQAGVSPEARARLLVDLKQKVWRLYADELPRLEGGRVYEFWLITADGAKVPMGSFTPDAQGRGTLSDKVPDPLPALAAAAVSDEPGPGARQPTGKLHVVGEFPKTR